MSQTATTHERQAHYFVPQPMPWPIMGSTALFCMTVGAALIFNSMTGGWVGLALGFMILLSMHGELNTRIPSSMFNLTS